MAQGTENVSRETLYAEVWAEPMTKVAARYGVAFSFLARVCERLGVPRPSQGYWERLKAGRASERPPLPEAEPGDELEWARDGEPRRASRPLPPAPAEPVPPGKVKRIERPSRHPLLAGATEHFDAARVSNDGYLKPVKRCLVDVYVTKDQLPRALAAANELFLTLLERGHRVVFPSMSERYHCGELDEREQPSGVHWEQAWRPDRPTLVLVGTVAVGLTLFESSEEVEVQFIDGKRVRVPPAVGRRLASATPSAFTSRHQMPSGRLALRAYAPYWHVPWERVWREDGEGKLVRRCAAIAEGIESAVPTIARLVEEREREAELARTKAEVQYREWQRQEVERRRAQAIQESRAELLSTIESWTLARQVEAFFEDVERRATGLGDADRVAVSQRLQRARELFGGVDALELLRRWRRPEER